MKKIKLKHVMLLAAALFTSSLFAQNWVNMMHNPEANFYDVQKAFNQYYQKMMNQSEKQKKKLAKLSGVAEAEGEAEVPGYEQYKRWEWFMQPRVGANGERFSPDKVWKEMEAYKKNYSTLSGAGAWTFLGPVSPSVPSNGGGAGRLNFCTIDPTNANNLWVGSPGGGLWKSTDGGSTWSSNTDHVAQIIGCTDLAIDPTNTQTMYLATGDGDGGDTYSVGLLKSTDGGTTWNPTGLSFGLAQYKQINMIAIDPSNTQNIYLATTNGIYKSTNGGSTFTSVLAGSWYNIKLKPGTSSTIYVSGTSFEYSTNSGSTWTAVAAPFPASTSVQRMSIAVSANNSAVVYAITAKTTTYDLEGLYKSTNSGASFTKLTVTPSSPSIIGTQGFYALSIAASPTNANEVIVGGLDNYRCTNVPSSGTAAFTQLSFWASGNPYVHADIHRLVYANGTTFYAACDGGLFVTTNSGTSWTDKSNGLQIAEMYGFGQSATNAGTTISGWQDNGTNVMNGSSWSRNIGGDGMLAFVDWNNDQNMWGSLYNGQLERSTNGGASFSAATSGITDPLNTWVTMWREDRTTANKLYAGFQSVWISTNGGSSWTKPGTVSTATVNIQALDASPANGQVIWAAKGTSLYLTTNGGTSWSAITNIPNGTISDIACSPTDAKKAWITYSGFSNVNKVFQTADQGVSWTNMSASLPNIPINCITVDKNGNDALYIGADGGGIFYRDATMNVWQPFMNGLPNVTVTQLEVFYSGSKIRASTYGRGLWESTLYAPGTYSPTANFGANQQIGCPSMGVQFSDWSAGQPTSWSWTFQGGTPATSTQQNPFIVYNSPGTYSVSLTVTNANGNDSKTVNGFITVNASPHAAPTASGKNYCGPATVSLSATPSAAGTVQWWNQPAGGTLLGTGNNYTTPSITGTQTYYVGESFPSGAADNVGAGDNTMGAGAMFTANDIRGLYFDVTKPVVINSVQVYCNSAGMRTIEILDNQGNWVTDTTLNIAANASTLQTVTINRTVYPGTGYIMKFRGTVDCYRNTAGATYPYTSATGDVTITNSNAGLTGYYYFFYNWAFTEIVCSTSRTAVTVTDTCTASGITDLFSTNYIDVYPNPNNGEFSVAFHIDNSDSYVVKITNAIGQTVYEERLDNFSGTYSKKMSLASLRKGVYMLSVSNSKNETVKKVLIY